jgi:phage-related protein (TIGR01555 family)
MRLGDIWSRLDGWMNVLTGLGGSRDKRTNTTFQARIINSVEAMNLWIGDDTARRAVEILPNEMTREGFEFKLTDDKELQEEIEQEWESLGVQEKIWTALAYKRSSGGGAILVGTLDNAAQVSESLDVARVREITHLTVFEPREMQPLTYYTDPMEPKYGEVRTWQVTTSTRGMGADGATSGHTHVVHESRLLVFRGRVVSRYDEPEFAGWGHNIFTHLWSVLSDYKIGWESTGHLLHDFSQAVIKIEGLAQIMASANGKQLFQDRIESMMMSNSVLRAVVLDSNEEYQRHTTDIAGLRDILRAFAERMSSALDIPLTLFLGISPGGMNSTGESDVRMFYDRVKAKQVLEVVPKLQRLVEMQLAKRGRLDTKAKIRPWSIAPRPLWQESDGEKAEARNKQAQSDAVYIDRDVLSPRQVAESRFGGDEYSFETSVDMAEFDTMEAEREEQRQQMTEALARQPENPVPPQEDDSASQ